MQATAHKHRSCRVVLVSTCDSLAALACTRLVSEDHRHSLVGIVRVAPSLRYRLRVVRAAVRNRALFYLGYMLTELYLPRLIARGGTINGKTRSAGAAEVRGIERPKAIPVHATSDLNEAGVHRFVEEVHADVVLAVRPGQIIRSATIERLPPILNLHCSRLPDYRGIGGVFQALAAGERVLGATVHRVSTEEIDRGDIIAQAELPVVEGGSVFHHSLSLYVLARDVLVEALDNIVLGAPVRSNMGGSYFSWPDRAALRRLHAKGHRLVDRKDLVRLRGVTSARRTAYHDVYRLSGCSRDDQVD